MFDWGYGLQESRSVRRRHVHAVSSVAELPSVVHAGQRALLQLAHAHGDRTVRTNVGNGHDLSVGVAVDDHGLSPKPSSEGFVVLLAVTLSAEGGVARKDLKILAISRAPSGADRPKERNKRNKVRGK